jgi:hypothetical protein
MEMSLSLEMLTWDDKVMSVVGHIDEIHILSVVRAEPIVGYLSPSQICDVYCQTLRFLSSVTTRKFGLGPRVHTDSQ